MNVTVTDATGRYITDLGEKDFDVFEDGTKQELTLFNRTNLPVALSLLIDTSSSMEDRIGIAQDAAVGFIRKLRPTDLGEVIGFDSRAEVLQKFTNNLDDLEQAIRKTVAGGSTSLNNALYISLKGLKKVPVRQEEEIRRQAIILLSDGEDTSSLVTFEDVLDLARRSETAVYAIGLMEDASSAQSKGFREATYALRQLATDTGGRAFFPQDIKSLASVYGQIYDELSSQYTIGYVSKNSRRDGAWRRLVVRVNRPNVQARTKQGYFAPMPSGK
jgi:Ca-activated chloride channel family protein